MNGNYKLGVLNGAREGIGISRWRVAGETFPQSLLVLPYLYPKQYARLLLHPKCKH